MLARIAAIEKRISGPGDLERDGRKRKRRHEKTVRDVSGCRKRRNCRGITLKCKNCGKGFVQTRRDFSIARQLWPQKSLRDFCSPECKEAANWRSNHVAGQKYKEKLKKQRLEAHKNLSRDGDLKARKSGYVTCCFLKANNDKKSGSGICFQAERKLFGISWRYCRRDFCWYPESHCQQKEVN